MSARQVKVTSPAVWTPTGLAGAVAGEWQPAPPEPQTTFAGVCTDSRTIQPGALFIALRGERFEGHEYVKDALQKGAAAAMVARDALLANIDTPLLVVDDTLAALQQMARTWRDALRENNCKVIAVAGSNGKTTTRHMIHTILNGAPTSTNQERLKGTQAPGSFNNHIGVPLTLLGAAADDDFVAVEIGTNHPGDVAALGEIARPDVAVIVSIGREHLEHFGDVAAVAQEELSLLAHVQRGGLALVPTEPNVTPHPPVNADHCQVQRITSDEAVTRELPMPGAHAAHNASAAAQVARWMGVNDDHIRAALSRFEPVPGRFAVRNIGAVTVIDDAYNANPDSVAAALRAVSEHWSHAPRRVLVLGDMLELGDAAAPLHREVGRLIDETRPGFAVVAAIGRLATFAASELRRLQPEATVYAWPEWEESLPQRVAAVLDADDVVLLKGSRGMGVERVIPAIEAKFQVASSKSRV